VVDLAQECGVIEAYAGAGSGSEVMMKNGNIPFAVLVAAIFLGALALGTYAHSPFWLGVLATFSGSALFMVPWLWMAR
jgi:hypothetical protein